jgi:hypothetical protein
MGNGVGIGLRSATAYENPPFESVVITSFPGILKGRQAFMLDLDAGFRPYNMKDQPYA